jgi:hypothetical protein
MSATDQGARTGVEQTLASVRAELRVGDIVGFVRPHKDGICVTPNPFFGGVLPAPTTVNELEWRIGRDRYTALAPVRASSTANGIVLGAFRHVQRMGTVKELDWRLLFVDIKGERETSRVHRVRYADEDFLRVSAPADLKAAPGQVWVGHVRTAEGNLQIRAQVRGVHVWGSDGTRVVSLRWVPHERSLWNDELYGRQAM